MHGGTVKEVQNKDITIAFELEAQGYPPDEAATQKQLTQRQSEAPQLFLGYYEDNTLYGFVCGTRHTGPDMKEESMKEHIKDGDIVCIHSVCVAEKKRRQGIARRLLKEYLRQVEETQKGVTKIMLLCKSNLIPLYTRANFTFVRKSPIVHGKENWYEMEHVLPCV